MKESKPIVCSICNQSMLPVDLEQVPAENIKDFVSNPGNKLVDNWFWCSECDSYELCSTPIGLSPETERLEQELKSFMSDW